MAWVNPPTRSTGYKVTSANWNDVVNDLSFLAEIGYVEYTADVSSTATTVGTATQVVSLGAITYTADPCLIEFYSPRLTPGGGGGNVILRDGTSVLGAIATYATTQVAVPLFVQRRFTPSAGSHTYNVAIWSSAAATITAGAGVGGAGGSIAAEFPGFIRATYLPT